MIIKVKLYELLETLIQLDNEIINKSVNERAFLSIIMVSKDEFNKCV